jgi:hypothetical protein
MVRVTCVPIFFIIIINNIIILFIFVYLLYGYLGVVALAADGESDLCARDIRSQESIFIVALVDFKPIHFENPVAHEYLAAFERRAADHHIVYREVLQYQACVGVWVGVWVGVCGWVCGWVVR